MVKRPLSRRPQVWVIAVLTAALLAAIIWGVNGGLPLSERNSQQQAQTQPQALAQTPESNPQPAEPSAPQPGLTQPPPPQANVMQPNCEKIGQREGSGFYEPNPTYTDQRDDTADWQFSTPQAEKLDGDLLNSGVEKLFTNESLLSVIVIRNGKIVLERYGNGGGQLASNNIHSASKAMIHALAGIAAQQGHINSLDDPAAHYLPAQFAGLTPQAQTLTLRQLLAMKSGLSWKEDSTETQIETHSDWVASILAQPFTHAPGESFHYNTGNTHVVSGVLQAATKKSTCAFAQSALFGPLNITTEHWGRDPQGVNSGGFNVYMTARELAKFGLLYAQGGKWNGKQVVPESTVADAFTEQTPPDEDGFGYSGGWWTRTIAGHDMFIAWGWGGQFLYVIPELDLVFSTTQNTHEDHTNEEIDSGEFVENVLIPAVK